MLSERFSCFFSLTLELIRSTTKEVMKDNLKINEKIKVSSNGCAIVMLPLMLGSRRSNCYKVKSIPNFNQSQG